eukprot:gene19195-110_t
MASNNLAARKALQLLLPLEAKQLQAFCGRRAATVRSPTVQQLRPTCWPDSSLGRSPSPTSLSPVATCGSVHQNEIPPLCLCQKRICDTGSRMFGLRESEQSRTYGTVNYRE